MARSKKNIEFIKDKVGKLFIKANSIVTDDNVSLEDKIKILETTVTSNSGSGASVASAIDATKYAVLSCYATSNLTYSVVPFVYNNKYYFSISQYMHIGNNMYAFGGVTNTNCTIKVLYVKK